MRGCEQPVGLKCRKYGRRFFQARKILRRSNRYPPPFSHLNRTAQPAAQQEGCQHPSRQHSTSGQLHPAPGTTLALTIETIPPPVYASASWIIRFSTATVLYFYCCRLVSFASESVKTVLNFWCLPYVGESSVECFTGVLA